MPDTINEYLRKYIDAIFRELDIREKVEPKTIDNMIDVIQRDAIADLMEEKLSENQIKEYMNNLAEAENKQEKAKSLINNLGEEDEVRDKIIEKANDLVFRFIDTLKEDGTITEQNIENLYNYLNSLKKKEI
ncbi:hypothetical protein GF389_03860 [Candidatus Dojkabacteria bacterium]|nr:hypothetical protein [Candidatus Dojkabacteria bacterium]